MLLVEIYYNQANQNLQAAQQILMQKHPQSYYGQSVMMPHQNTNQNFMINESFSGQDWPLNSGN